MKTLLLPSYSLLLLGMGWPLLALFSSMALIFGDAGFVHVGWAFILAASALLWWTREALLFFRPEFLDKGVAIVSRQQSLFLVSVSGVLYSCVALGLLWWPLRSTLFVILLSLMVAWGLVLQAARDRFKVLLPKDKISSFRLPDTVRSLFKWVRLYIETENGVLYGPFVVYSNETIRLKEYLRVIGEAGSSSSSG